MGAKKISIQKEAQVPFHNQVDYCVGTGRMGLALQKEYQEQLKRVQQEIGFSHIRGHGLFSEDMAIYHEYEENGEIRAEYNFTYLDLVMDSYLELNIAPFLELGFMPDKLASGKQTIFYWKGNTTPPKSYEGWAELVKATLQHLIDRYGREKVVTWPVEVWNEPNLPGFWEHADMQEYFKLFEVSLHAVKEVDESFRVGGPAICGVDDERWMRKFLTFCRDRKLALDFVTRHHYTTDFPKDDGHYGYVNLSPFEDGFTNLHTSREIIDSFEEFKGMEMHITEFNSSYIPNCPLHDTNQNAAWIAHQLSRLGEDNESYSYWTFGDVFEEHGVPFSPFHGGFGLVANGGIEKPTFWSFAFFKRLKEMDGHCVYRDENAVIMNMADGSYRGVLWQAAEQRSGEDCELTLVFPVWKSGAEYKLTPKFPAQKEQECAADGAKEERYCLITESVTEETCNPLKVWHDMGEPASLTKGQLMILQNAAKPEIRSEEIKEKDGKCSIHLQIPEFGVVYFTLEHAPLCSDRGYHYEKVK